MLFSNINNAIIHHPVHSYGISSPPIKRGTAFSKTFPSYATLFLGSTGTQMYRLETIGPLLKACI